jgi:hypothetical protein
MRGLLRNGLVIIGAILVLLGVLALASPIFTTKQEKDVAKIGDIKVTTQEEKSHVVPPIVGGAALGVGIVLIGIGIVTTRRPAS